MIAAETAARFSNERPGMVLIDVVEVGLPCWRVLARCDVLARKPISPIDETLMRAIDTGLEDASNLQLFLGLDDVVFDAAMVGLVSQRWVIGSSEEPLALTEAGSEVLATAAEIRSEERVVPFHYDGLLRRPMAIEGSIEPRVAARQGLREVPPYPRQRPDLVELSACKGELERILRDQRQGRDQESELLGIRGYDRCDRVYRPALALLFAPERSGRPQLAFAIDGELSSEHEAAFAGADQMQQIGVERGFRSRRSRPLPLPGPRDLQAELDPDAERSARERVAAAAASLDGGTPEPRAEQELRAARKEFGALPSRTVAAHEHQILLDAALGAARSRLLIAGGSLSPSHLNPTFLRRLREALERGTIARIAVSPGTDRVDDLKALADDHSHLVLDLEYPERRDCILLVDDRFAVVGSYPWLGLLGDAKRPLGDRRSILTADCGRIDAFWDALDGRETRVQRRRRRRRRRTQQK